MKKLKLLVLTVISTIMIGCGSLGTMGGTSGGNSSAGGTNVLGGILDILSNPNTIGNVISSVIGTNKVTQAQLIGNWRYSAPGVAFTSEKALANAGGEVVAAQIKEKLLPTYNTLGLSASNTTFTYNENKSFSATIKGIPLSGSYTYDESNGKITYKTLLLSFNGYAKRNSNGIAVLFEAKQLLKVLQTITALSGNQTLEVIGEVSKQYDNVRLGFDVTK
jgi:hypothetical protein